MPETNSESVSESLQQEEHAAKSGKYKRWLGILIIAIFLVGIFSYINRGPKAEYNYQTTTVERGNITVTITAAGTLQPLNQVQVGSEISGLIEEVLVDANDFVEKNQVLARIDTDQLQAKLQQSQAALRVAQARHKEAQATVRETENIWRRKQELAKTGMCTQEECEAAEASYLRAKAAVASAQAQVFQAEAQVEADQTLLAKAQIRAPINGIVLSRNVEPGQTVAASFQTPVLFTLAEDLRRMQLHVDVDEADIGQIATRQQATFSVDAYPQQRFEAEITKVYFAPKVVQDVVTYEALLQVNNEELLLRPGMTATADIITQQVDDALLVPNAALRFAPPAVRDTRSSVLRSILPGPPPQAPKQRKIVDSIGVQRPIWTLEDDEPAPISVTVGVTNGRMTQIMSSDVKAGMEVIVDAIRIKN